jgi:glutamate-1-semialdehyde 2,1-aminomutase
LIVAILLICGENQCVEINREHLKKLIAKEEERFKVLHPKSGHLFDEAKKVMPNGVPMSWMAKWPGAYPLFVDTAQGAHFTDVDGNEYIDFCLGDTGSMTGHSPKATTDAVTAQMKRGITAMLPTEDALIVSKDLTARFGLPLWQFTVSATDANRHSIRYRQVLSRQR